MKKILLFVCLTIGSLTTFAQKISLFDNISNITKENYSNYSEGFKEISKSDRLVVLERSGEFISLTFSADKKLFYATTYNAEVAGIEGYSFEKEKGFDVLWIKGLFSVKKNGKYIFCSPETDTSKIFNL